MTAGPTGAASLVRILAQLFPDETDSLRLMNASGIDAGRIHYESKPLTRWYLIVDEARKAELVGILIQVALAQYPENAELSAMAANGKVAAMFQRRPTILAIWPEAPGLAALDVQGEADALYNAGYDYVALRGPEATRAGVVREWARLEPEIVEVGAHGKDGKIHLTDGPTRPGWWGRLALDHQPRLVVLLACESSKPDVENTADALRTVGVPAILSIDAGIQDSDAVRFVRLLYQGIAQGKTLQHAVERAKLALTDEGAEMVRLWAEQGWQMRKTG